MRTDRLIFTSWEAVSANELFEIYGDPEVTRLLGDGAFDASIDESENRRVGYAQQMHNLTATQTGQGFGIWPVRLASNNQLVGTMMLKPLPDGDGLLTNDIEVGWHLRRSSWGQGLATEAGQLLIQRAFDHGIETVYAVMYKENTASQKVARRLGMTHVGSTAAYYGTRVELFKIDATTSNNEKRTS
ncbi:MAG: GNAT family N-acetyltransferase [Planctomycetota bacterium]